MVRRGTLVVVLAFLAALPAFGRDEVQFARALARAGYYDLALAECDRIRKSSSADRKAVPLVLGELYKLQADEAKDPIEKTELINKAIDELDHFLKAAGKTDKKRNEALFTLAELLQQKGQSLVEQVQARQGGTAERKQAHEIFEKAEKFLDDLEKQFLRQKKERPNEYMRARYLTALCKYHHGMALEKGNPGRDELFNDCASHVWDFVWDYEDRIATYDLLIYRGLAFIQLEKLQDALTAFDYVIALQNRPTEWSDQVKELIFKAYYHKSETARVMKLPEKAVEFIDKMYAAFPDDTDKGWFRKAWLSQAEAYVEMDELSPAVAIAQRVGAGGLLSGTAKDLLSKWEPFLAGLSFEDRFNILESLMHGQDYRGAVAQCRKMLPLRHTDPEALAYLPRMYVLMGQAYMFMESFYESILAYQTCYKEFPEDELAPEAAKGAGLALGRAIRRGKLRYDSRMRKNMIRVLEHYGDPNAKYLVAEDLENEDEYLEAARKFLEVPRESNLYWQAQSRAGYCYYQQAKKLWDRDKRRKAAEVKKLFGKAEESLSNYIETAKNPPEEASLTPDELASLKRYAFACLDCLSLIYAHDAIKRYDEVEALLKDVDRDYAGQNDKIAKAWGRRIFAFIQKGELDSARGLLDRTIGKFKDARATPYACRELASAYEAAVSPAGDDDEGGKKALRALAAHYYYIWLQLSLERGARVRLVDLDIVGDKLVTAARELTDTAEKRQKLMQARELYLTMMERAEARGAKPPVDEKTYDLKMSEIAVELGDWARAYEAYAKLAEQEPRNGVFKQMLARCAHELAREEGQRSERWAEALDGYRTILPLVPEYSEVWWQCEWAILEILYETGRYREVANVIEILKLQTDLGEGFGTKEKILDLEKEAKRRAEKR